MVKAKFRMRVRWIAGEENADAGALHISSPDFIAKRKVGFDTRAVSV
jgi:hypothetical protein